MMTLSNGTTPGNHSLRYWPFVQGIHRWLVNSLHKGQWCGALIFPLICTRINGPVNNREAGDLRRHQAHYDVTVMTMLGHSSDTGQFSYACRTGTWIGNSWAFFSFIDVHLISSNKINGPSTTIFQIVSKKSTLTACSYFVIINPLVL